MADPVNRCNGRSDDPFYGSKELKYHGPNRWKGGEKEQKNVFGKDQNFTVQ